MDPVILDNIPVNLDLDTLAQKLRIKPASSHFPEFARLVEAALAIGRPRAYYRMAYVEERGEDYVVIDGVRFSSRILRMNLDKPNHVFVYVATCGQELEAWACGYSDLLPRFWADAISEAILRVASQALADHLAERYQPGRTSHMNPGSLKDWPIAEQVPLFNLLGDVRGAIGVYLTESLLMLPRKSVSGIEFPTEASFASCQLCPRDICPGRRAPYDLALVAKYLPTSAPAAAKPVTG